MTLIMMNKVSPGSLMVQKWSLNIPEMNAAISCRWCNLQPEYWPYNGRLSWEHKSATTDEVNVTDHADHGVLLSKWVFSDPYSQHIILSDKVSRFYVVAVHIIQLGDQCHWGVLVPLRERGLINKGVRANGFCHLASMNARTQGFPGENCNVICKACVYETIHNYNWQHNNRAPWCLFIVLGATAQRNKLNSHMHTSLGHSLTIRKMENITSPGLSPHGKKLDLNIHHDVQYCSWTSQYETSEYYL